MEKVNVKFLAVPLFGFLLGLGLVSGAPAQKKKKTAPASKSTTSKSTTSAKTATGARGKTTAASKGKSYARTGGRSPQPVAARRRYGQQNPTEDRHNEIQKALATRGYLSSEPTGKWDTSTVEAMKRFQQDQNLPPTGKITSLSLIALGLGPKRERAATSSVAPPDGASVP